jgi:membrane protein DedA with SNARE-associated domain
LVKGTPHVRLPLPGMRRSSSGSGDVRLAISAFVWAGVAAVHLHLHLHHSFFHHLFHHRFHGPPFDYVGLAFGSLVSSAGFPGPGEALLIAGAIIAAAGKLDIVSVIAIAFAGAVVGGILGWMIGLKAGRAVFTAPGPLYRARLRALERGDRIFHRQVALAVIFTPAWVAGIHRVRSRIYQPLNALSAALWAVGVGLGAYYVGPRVADFLGDLGLATLILIGVVLIGGVAFEVLRRRRGGERHDADSSPQPGS